MADEETPRKRRKGGEPLGPLCAGVTSRGRACHCRAAFPIEEPRWCRNCDPGQAEARRQAGALRRRPAPSERTRAAAGSPVATVDRIVELCLRAADKVQRGKLSPPAGQAMKGLYGKALDAIKARATTGDARGLGQRDLKPGNVPQPSPTPTAPPAPDEHGDLDALGRALDA